MNNSNHQVVDIRAMDVGYFSVKLSLGRKMFDGDGDFAPYSSKRQDRFGSTAASGQLQTIANDCFKGTYLTIQRH
jgi:hypothetical protein